MTEIKKYWLDPFWKKINMAMQEGNTKEFISLVESEPTYLYSKGEVGGNWLIDAIAYGAQGVFDYMLEKGIDVNAEFGGPAGGDTALTKTVQVRNVEMAKLLLERGANSNIGRILFSVCRMDQDIGRQFFKLLSDHGIELNRVFAMFGDASNALSALDFAGTGPFADVFRKAGAKTAKEILAENPNTPIEGADPKK